MNTVVLGNQAGDEAKGRVVDLLAPNYDIICRASSGANSGHTIIVNGQKHIFRLLPSAVLYPDKHFILGQGMVIDFNVLYDEVITLERLGLDIRERLVISKNAHLVLPYHMEIDEAREEFMHIGTTKKGIGPAYESKVRRTGVRAQDTLNASIFQRALKNDLKHWDPLFKEFRRPTPDYMDPYLDLYEKTEYFARNIQDTHPILRKATSVLFEGAQGTLLDINSGMYPYITSSSCNIGGILNGAGVSHRQIDKVIGVVKAFCTRVAAGDFPTEIVNEFVYDEVKQYDVRLSDKLREVGKEYGSVTKRPRRVGWLDLPAIKYAIEVNGVDEMVISKLDVLSALDNIKLCIGYQKDNKLSEYFWDYQGPYPSASSKPVYLDFEGWKDDISQVRNFNDLPKAAQQYLNYIENYLQTPISMISVGPQREAMIEK